MKLDNDLAKYIAKSQLKRYAGLFLLGMAIGISDRLSFNHGVDCGVAAATQKLRNDGILDEEDNYTRKS